MRSLLLALLLSAAMLPPAGYAKNAAGKKPEKDPSRGINFYSIEREIALGRQMAQEVERQAKLLDDEKVTEYVNRIGQNIVRNSDAKVPFTIKVIESDDVNAFALPGGYLFVNTGLVLKAANEAELAGVMAHEIAHVAARHGTRQATRGELVNYASIPLIFMGGWAGYAVRQAAGLAVPLGFLKFSRGFEEEADRLGLEYLDRAGYDPTAFIDFFEKVESLEKKKPGTIAQVFSTHPMTASRIKSAQKEIDRDLVAHPEYVVDTSEFHEVHDRLRMLEAGRKPKDTPHGPTLKRRTETGGKDEDDRPTLKRQP